MALQELDLRIEYRPGKSNVRADALSRYPVSLLPRDCLETVAPTLVAAMETPHTLFESGEGSRDLTLRERQCKDTPEANDRLPGDGESTTRREASKRARAQ